MLRLKELWSEGNMFKAEMAGIDEKGSGNYVTGQKDAGLFSVSLQTRKIWKIDGRVERKLLGGIVIRFWDPDRRFKLR